HSQKNTAGFIRLSRITLQEGFMKLNRAAAVVTMGAWIAFAGSLQAEDRTDFTRLQSVLKPNDKVTVTKDDGSSIQGRMLEISADRIVLTTQNGQRSFDRPQISKVQKRKNGVLLGAIIGGGAAVVP